jgi:hypothetical protein
MTSNTRFVGRASVFDLIPLAYLRHPYYITKEVRLPLLVLMMQAPVSYAKVNQRMEDQVQTVKRWCQLSPLLYEIWCNANVRQGIGAAPSW